MNCSTTVFGLGAYAAELANVNSPPCVPPKTVASVGTGSEPCRASQAANWTYAPGSRAIMTYCEW